ncbi:porin family protein [Rhodopseudomonas palustris]|nr:porin family protein [Rhodopseudomonas palustris]
MRSVKMILAAGAASLICSAAVAADMPIAPPPAYAPPPVEDFGGWYLRGDIGFSNQQVKRLDNALDANALTSRQAHDFSAAGIYGLGVGYQFNNWFRADVTGQYRGNSTYRGTDNISFNNGGAVGFGANNYTASKSEWLVMANGYVDLGTWWCITPFVGAGVGGARVTIANFTDAGLASLQGGGIGPSFAYGDTVSRWNLAWALHAGLAYKVNPNVTLELAYSYLDLGKGVTGDLRAFDGTNNINNPTTFRDITSHDLKLGVRWNLESAPTYYPPPLMRKG